MKDIILSIGMALQSDGPHIPEVNTVRESGAQALVDEKYAYMEPSQTQPKSLQLGS